MLNDLTDVRPRAGSDLAAVLESRRSIPAARLVAPGPSAQELRRMVMIAARVPDHGAIVPWRFIVIEGGARKASANRLKHAASQAFAGDEAAALRIAGKLETLFEHPPLVIIVVSRPDPSASIPVWEQTLSAGAACMNLLVAAAALGFGANWLTGWAATHPAARPVLGLADGESVAGIIPVGTPAETPPDRPRPDPARIVTTWAG